MGMVVCLLRVSRQELQGILADSSLLEDMLEEQDERVEDVEKAWEGLIYLLSGRGLNADDGPVQNLSRVIFSGQPVDDTQDLGMGPAHYLTPEQVLLATRELEQISADDLARRYDPVAMSKAKIYPDIWNTTDTNALDYVLEYFDVLKACYQAAAQEGEGMITFLS